MSKIGKQPIAIPKNVTIDIKDVKKGDQIWHSITVKGPKGELVKEFWPVISFELKEDKLFIGVKDDTKPELDHNAFWGLARALVSNMINGVTEGFSVILEMVGVGYKAQVKGNTLELSLGFSHPIEYLAPEGITFEADKTVITIRGIDKQLVGQVAAEIRAYRKPEPYKGKGIMYRGEKIRRKAGKKAAT